MATSGSADWTNSRDDIITRACRKAKIINSGAVPSTNLLAEASDALNAIVKNLQTDGVHIWAVEWVDHPLTASSEVTGTDGEVYTCIRGHTSAPANEPITGASWSTYWVKRGSTGGVWATATEYESIGDFDLEADLIAVDKAFYRRDGKDYPLVVKDFQDYADIHDKALEGIPGIFYINQKLSPQRGYLVPQPDDAENVLHYHKIRHLEDFDDPANTPDFPVRWIDILVRYLAADLGEDYNLLLSEVNNLRKKADRDKIKAMGADAPKTDDNFVEPAYD